MLVPDVDIDELAGEVEVGFAAVVGEGRPEAEAIGSGSISAWADHDSRVEDVGAVVTRTWASSAVVAAARGLPVSGHRRPFSVSGADRFCVGSSMPGPRAEARLRLILGCGKRRDGLPSGMPPHGPMSTSATTRSPAQRDPPHRGRLRRARYGRSPAPTTGLEPSAQCHELSGQGEDRPVPALVGHPGDIGHDVLDLGVLLEGVGRHVLAEATGLESAVRHLTDDRDVVVDPTQPAWSSRIARCARRWLVVHADAASPYGESFASAIASSSESTGRTTRTGPKTSSQTISERRSASVMTVGSK